MSVNRYLEHIVFLPEDYANRQIANGFCLGCESKRLKVESEIGGWRKVIDFFLTDFVSTMRLYSKRNVVLIIDFDGDPKRLDEIRSMIPVDVSERAFVFGCLTEPEDVKRAGFGSFENIGRSLVNECLSNNEKNIWSHELLANNYSELERFKATACQILLD